MTRKFVGLAMATMLCHSLFVTHIEAQERGGTKPRGNGPQSGSLAQRRPGGNEARPPAGRGPSGGPQGARGATPGGSKPPGGDWSEKTHGGKTSNGQLGNSNDAGKAGAAAKHNESQDAGGHGPAAAGAAAANRNAPKDSGAEGAAAGAAAANRNAPKDSGAEGAAVGAAAANRNAPQFSGAQGAAAGAAAANRNSPQFSGTQGAAFGAAAANRNSPAMSGAGGAASGYALARNSFNNSNVYSQQWYGNHPDAWAPAGWAAGSEWQASSWGDIANLCGYGNTAPNSYNYGVNVNSQDGNVVVNGQSVGTPGEYSQQASDLAESGAQADASADDQWLPVGVFAMVRNEQDHPQFIVQLAINSQGILRGNYTDTVADNTLPIHGAVDKNTQRAAWTVGENKQTVMEAGLADLTESETPALIHQNGKTDHWLLVRLAQQPQDGNNAGQ